MRAPVLAALYVTLVTCATTVELRGQDTPASVTRPEVRMDVIATGSRTSVQAGGGLQIPAGVYARIGIIGAAGTDFVNGATQPSGRIDVLGRFLLDPFRQARWGFSAGAGVSLRAHSGDHVRPVLLAALDWEGPRSSSGIAPAIQLGLGGGIRAGVALRWAATTER